MIGISPGLGPSILETHPTTPPLSPRAEPAEEDVAGRTETAPQDTGRL